MQGSNFKNRILIEFNLKVHQLYQQSIKVAYAKHQLGVKPNET